MVVVMPVFVLMRLPFDHCVPNHKFFLSSMRVVMWMIMTMVMIVSVGMIVCVIMRVLVAVLMIVGFSSLFLLLSRGLLFWLLRSRAA